LLTVNYSSQVIEVKQTPEFERWLDKLKDRAAARKIAQRIVRLGSGLMGGTKLFKGIGELRVDFGPGYRIYFMQRGSTLVILLCGGDKSSQSRDIERALSMAKELRT
jgi:putative addiction module killer protein